MEQVCVGREKHRWHTVGEPDGCGCLYSVSLWWQVMGVVLSLATQTVKNMVCIQLQESERSTYRSSAERRLHELVASNVEKRSLQLLLCAEKKERNSGQRDVTRAR